MAAFRRGDRPVAPTYDHAHSLIEQRRYPFADYMLFAFV